ncbi:hypothetical protein ACNR9Q_12810 [Maribacter sp. X9]|uniref:hypothetical protein n=1 Tax=Maribacter sp. X9 TaxID=3402159 RepID=UPI003AF3BAF2
MLVLNKRIGQVKKSSPFLYTVVLFHLILAIGCIVGLSLDDRTVMGINVWVKPLKFGLSGAIYIFTLGYLTTLYPFSERKKKWISNTVAWTLLLEILIIAIQAARGVQSHYNTSSTLDGLLFLAMGILIGINVLIMLLFIIESVRLKMSVSKPMQWAIFFGWCILFFGSWVGGQMISQLGHNVGIPDSGEGIPIVNWSSVAGDLRIAHFFGLHGLQLVPLVAFFIQHKTSLSKKQELTAVCLFALVYALWIGYTFYQAKMGKPVFS